MRITGVDLIQFEYLSAHVRDAEGHGHPGPQHTATGSIVQITTDEGISGFSMGGAPIMLEPARQVLIGEDLSTVSASGRGCANSSASMAPRCTTATWAP